MDQPKVKLPRGIKQRELYEGEVKYFRQNPSVAGMATDDGFVILNPFAELKPEEFQSVAVNESARLVMREDPNFAPDFQLTAEQSRFLDTTTYRSASQEDRLSTIAARILSGDPSGGIPTPEQVLFVSKLKERLFGE